jgi:hypothetical protein
VHLVRNDSEKEESKFYPHIRIKRIAPFSGNCTIQCWDDKHQTVSDTLLLITSEAHEIAGLLWEFSAKFY